LNKAAYLYCWGQLWTLLLPIIYIAEAYCPSKQVVHESELQALSLIRMDTSILNFALHAFDQAVHPLYDFPPELLRGLALACGGLAVGIIVGLTGVGGGSLMTPLLILLFGIKPHLAIGTDLLFAAITKSGALPNLIMQRRIDWPVVALLALGSLPASLMTMKLMRIIGPSSETWQALSCKLLGAMLVLTAASMLYKALRMPQQPKLIILELPDPSAQIIGTKNESVCKLTFRKTSACIALGLVLGMMVTLTSVGAGAIGTAILIALFPAMPLARIVGNDIAHAIPLTLMAGLGHAWLGTVDWQMLAWLLTGSLPGIWLGTRNYQRCPERWLRGGLSILLAYAGIRLALI
jgi:uncharacterized protein